MSPESLADRTYSEKTDVWRFFLHLHHLLLLILTSNCSFGVTLFELLSSQDPYHDMDLIQVATRVARGDLKLLPPPNADPFLSNLMLMSLSFDARQRPTFKEICLEFSKNERTDTLNQLKKKALPSVPPQKRTSVAVTVSSDQSQGYVVVPLSTTTNNPSHP